MGPPIFIGGNQTLAAPEVLTEQASMGPPIFIGGNAGNTSDSRRFRSSLQWGHRFSSVEIIRRRVHITADAMLQWGHRFSSVEMPLANPVR